MGRSRAIKYVVSAKCSPATAALTQMEWRVTRDGNIPGDGKPTEANLAKWVAVYNASFQPGGVNQHAGPLTIVSAKIVRQADYRIMAEYAMPMFQVV